MYRTEDFNVCAVRDSEWAVLVHVYSAYGERDSDDEWWANYQSTSALHWLCQIVPKWPHDICVWLLTPLYTTLWSNSNNSAIHTDARMVLTGRQRCFLRSGCLIPVVRCYHLRSCANIIAWYVFYTKNRRMIRTGPPLTFEYMRYAVCWCDGRVYTSLRVYTKLSRFIRFVEFIIFHVLFVNINILYFECSIWRI